MEIVSLLGFADAIFRRERSDDRKCVCASQATARRESKFVEVVDRSTTAFTLECFDYCACT